MMTKAVDKPVSEILQNKIHYVNDNSESQAS